MILLTSTQVHRGKNLAACYRNTNNPRPLRIGYLTARYASTNNKQHSVLSSPTQSRLPYSMLREHQSPPITVLHHVLGRACPLPLPAAALSSSTLEAYLCNIVAIH